MSERSIRVRVTKTLGPNQHPERGLFTVPPDEATLIARGLVIQVARERLDNTDRAVSNEEVLKEATSILADIEAELERLLGTE